MHGVSHSGFSVGQPGFRLERHGQPRRGAGDLDRDQRILQIAIPARMRQPDVTGPESLAQMEQNRDFPKAACLVSIRVQMPQPFRAPAKECQWQHRRRLRARDDRARRQQRFRHGRGTDVERPQHARGITPEPMISVTDMHQRIGGERVG